jgi:hypothetical protein
MGYQVESRLFERLMVEVVADPDRARNDEVHLEHLFFLVVDNVLVGLVSECPRLQSECDIVEKPGVFVLLWIEEGSEVVKHIVKQEVHDDCSFDRAGQLVRKLIVLLHLVDTVVAPIVLEVAMDLFGQVVRKRPLLSEPDQLFHPVVQFVRPVLGAAPVRVECLQNLNETTHNERKEADPC